MQRSSIPCFICQAPTIHHHLLPPTPQVLSELKQLVEYRAKYFQGKAPEILALGLSSRKNLCVNTKVVGEWRGRAQAGGRVHQPRGAHGIHGSMH